MLFVEMKHALFYFQYKVFNFKSISVKLSIIRISPSLNVSNHDWVNSYIDIGVEIR